MTSLGSHHVSGDVVNLADARRFGPLVNGSWAGAWRDDAGRSGTSDVTLAVDPVRLKARGTLTFDGPLLAGEMTGTRVGGRVAVRYTITDAGGRMTKGTAAWAKGSVRATPQDPRKTVHDSPADIESGLYATDFFTAIDLSKAVGRPMKPPIDNGGRIAYDVGIDVANTYAETVDGFLRTDLRVYRARSAAAATAFWKKQLLHQPDVPGPWKAGFFQAPHYAVFYSWVGNLVFITSVGPTVAGAKRIPPSATLVRDCQAVAAAVARAAAKR